MSYFYKIIKTESAFVKSEALESEIGILIKQ